MVPNALLSSLFGTAVMSTPMPSAPTQEALSAGRAAEGEYCSDYRRDAAGGPSMDDDDRASAAPTQCSTGMRRVASQQVPRADEAVFAVPGITCVGCLIGKARLAEVTSFVNANMQRMPTNKGSALWRLAEDVYNTKVKVPCEREGLVDVPSFPHEQIWHHFRYHELLVQLTSVDKCRELRGIREMLTKRIVRYNADTKDREIDQRGLDQYMKLCALERTEQELLQRIEAGGAGPARARGRGAGGTSAGGGGGSGSAS